jgi:hypothetical protein
MASLREFEIQHYVGYWFQFITTRTTGTVYFRNYSASPLRELKCSIYCAICSSLVAVQSCSYALSARPGSVNMKTSRRKRGYTVSRIAHIVQLYNTFKTLCLAIRKKYELGQEKKKSKEFKTNLYVFLDRK